MRENSVEIGILTFHCSDNFGAMLQAYGLKRCLQDSGMKNHIIRYEPFYMTGRHWFLPYLPRTGQGRWWCLWNMWNGFKGNMGRRKEFCAQRANMRFFRKRYLLEKGQRKLRFARDLEKLPYQYYVVGSDQIWNPEITCGLRRVYFGAFRNRCKKKTIAYAASLGGIALDSEYDEEFAGLINFVDAVSMREEGAIPYVKRFFKGEIMAVVDPVFLLEEEEWHKVEKKPDKKDYIFTYITEENQELADYVKRLSQETGLSVVELQTGDLGTGGGFDTDLTAGPAEFLGYIHYASYVVTNSFHAAAFSIIFQKRFLVFAHSRRGARLQNILKIHGLEDRMCVCGCDGDIDGDVDWQKVRGRREDVVKKSREYLLGNLAV